MFLNNAGSIKYTNRPNTQESTSQKNVNFINNEAKVSNVECLIPASEKDEISNKNKNFYYNTIYNEKNDELYPLRCSGKPQRIKKISAMPCVNSNKLYTSNKVKPFITSNITPEKRCQLYHSNLKIKKFTEHDLKNDDYKYSEIKLLGQDTVVARHAIPKGTCIGVYGGEIINSEHPISADLKVHQYVMIIKEGPNEVNVFNNGIIGKINTRFKRIGENKFTQAPPEDFNIDLVAFKIEVHGHTSCYTLPVLFTKRDISEGEDLRYNYGWDNSLIELLLNNNDKTKIQKVLNVSAQKRQEVLKAAKIKALNNPKL